MRIANVWRRWVFITLSLVAAAVAAVQGPAAEEGPWRCLLKRTSLDGGALRSTLYVADLVNGKVSALATFDDFDVAAAACAAGGDTVLVAGYPYGVPAQAVRIYRLDVASGDYTVVSNFDYPLLPEVGVAYDETEGVFYVAAWGNLDPYRGPEGFLLHATFIYRYDPTSAEVTPFNVYDSEFALVSAGGGALYVTTFGYINRELELGKVFLYLDGDSGDVHYTDFVAGEGVWDNSCDDKPAEDKGLWGDFIQERSWYTEPARYPPDGVRRRPIYYYSYDLLPPLSDHVEIYVNGPADGEVYRTLKADWRARDIFYSYRRDAAVYLIPGDSGPTEVVVTYGDGTLGPRLALPAYEPRGAIQIVELGYELSFYYSLLYVE
ncbi:MAG: hypothetical protein V3T41_10900 [bacterium]